MKNYYYDKIAKDYHLKRKKPWKPLQEFINYLFDLDYKFPGLCIDLGCGNGRNFVIFKDKTNKLIGIDNSIELLRKAKESLSDFTLFSKVDSNNITLILADLKYIPIREEMINNIFSIAAIHHIKGKEKRQEVICNLHNLIKKNGFLLVTVWRRWQKKLKKYFIIDKLKRSLNPKYLRRQNKMNLREFGDKYVSWTVSKEKRTYNRFYHFFSKKELKDLLKNYEIKEFKLTGGPTYKDNFFLLTQK